MGEGPCPGSHAEFQALPHRPGTSRVQPLNGPSPLLPGPVGTVQSAPGTSGLSGSQPEPHP